MEDNNLLCDYQDIAILMVAKYLVVHLRSESCKTNSSVFSALIGKLWKKIDLEGK